MIDKICNNCGDSFQVYKSRAERGRGKYCSKDCQYADKNTHKEFVCAECGVVETRQEKRLDRHENNFCSMECVNSFLTGESHGMWDGGSEKFTHTPEGRKWRVSVFERDEYTCQGCGAGGKDTYLNAHHIEPRHESPEKETDINNGVTLCIECHADKHDEPVASLILSQNS